MAADLTKSLEKLSAATERLKENSDRLNAVISEFESRLRGINAGVTVWLDGVENLLARWQLRKLVKEINEEMPSYDDVRINPDFIGSDGVGVEWWEGEQLGWARVGDFYCLAVRRVAENFYTEKNDLNEADKPIELARVRRELRLAAIPKLPALVEALTARVERFSADLEKSLASIKNIDGNLLPTEASGESTKGEHDDEPF